MKKIENPSLLISLWESFKLGLKNKKIDIYHRWLLFRHRWGLVKMMEEVDGKWKPTKEGIEINRLVLTARAFGCWMDQAEMGPGQRGEDTTQSSTTGFRVRKDTQGK